MVRISREELVQRWAQIYRDDGFDVRADGVDGCLRPDRINGAVPDIDARRDGRHVLVGVIHAPEDLANPGVQANVQRLANAQGNDRVLHLVVAAECMCDLRHTLRDWEVEPDTVHVT